MLIFLICELVTIMTTADPDAAALIDPYPPVLTLQADSYIRSRACSFHEEQKAPPPLTTTDAESRTYVVGQNWRVANPLFPGWYGLSPSSSYRRLSLQYYTTNRFCTSRLSPGRCDPDVTHISVGRDKFSLWFGAGGHPFPRSTACIGIQGLRYISTLPWDWFNHWWPALHWRVRGS